MQGQFERREDLEEVTVLNKDLKEVREETMGVSGRKEVPGRGSRKCKGPEVGPCLMY